MRHQSESSAEEAGPFVLNLCAVSGPVTIPQPRAPQFSRLTFFCTRGRGENDPAWWLRLGYFDTREDAQKWLDRLSRVYPKAVIAEAEMTFQAEQLAGRARS